MFRWVLEEIRALPYRPGLRWTFYRSMEKFQLGLPENFERPSEWQWEALGDEQARDIILQTLQEKVNVDELQAALSRAEKRSKEVADGYGSGSQPI